MHYPISSGVTFSVNKGLLSIDCDELHDIEIFDISGSKVLETIMQSQFSEFGHICILNDYLSQVNTSDSKKLTKPGKSSVDHFYNNWRNSGLRMIECWYNRRRRRSSLGSQTREEAECKKLVSFHNIKEELELNETDSWKKLIRVLTHEIMNSTAPISSSIKVISSLLRHEESDRIKNLNELSKEDITNTVRGLEIIEERSDGLNNFVESYRELTKNIEPYYTDFYIIEIFKSVDFLFAKDFKDASINWKSKVVPEDLILKADKNLIEQVVINLIKNSIEAINTQIKREISLEAFIESNKIIIKVIDTGIGISLEESDKVFIPFYTSKEEGSGIGLSLSRQIMQLHNGSITFESEKGTKTEFILKF